MVTRGFCRRIGFGELLDALVQDAFAGRLFYQSADIQDPEGVASLSARIREACAARGIPGNLLFYAAVAPKFYAPLVRRIAAACILLPALASAAGRVPVYPLPPGVELPSDILFKAEYPLNEMRPGEWTSAQKNEIAYFRERMRKDPRIFMLIRVTSDPIGSESETATWAERIAQGLAGRLQHRPGCYHQ